MASILVVEQEQRSLEKITQALGSEGWRIRSVPGRVQALQASAAEPPDLVLLSSDIPGAEELARAFQRSTGGPGVVVILPEHAEVGSGALPADDRLARPFSDQDLRNVVRRALSMKRLGGGPTPNQVRLTSQDIFGDVLAEVEGQGGLLGRGSSARLSVPSTPPSAPPQRSAAQRDAEAISRKLEETLHGVLGSEPRLRPTPAAVRETENASVEDLLSRTLSKLDMTSRPRPAAASPAAARPASPTPGPSPKPTPVIAAPAATAKPAQPPAPRVAEPTRPIERPQAAPDPVATPPRSAEPAAPVTPAVPVTPVAPLTPPPLAAVPTLRAPEAPAPATAPSRLAVAPAAKTPTLAKPATAPGRPVDEIAGTGIKKLGRSTGEFDLSQLDELAYPRRSRPDSTRPAPVAVPPRLPDPAATQRIQMPRDESDGGGERFGQYTLLEKIAVGGMAELWKARMRGVEGFQKTVAIKKILPHMTDNAEFVGMFIDEAKLAAQLNHPNIIHIYDLGKIGRDYYIAMEFVEGKDLRSLLNGARRQGLSLPLGLALLIAARLADALEYAHNKRDFEGRGMGLVHRDVSPQNVLLSLDGDVKLCDFGIAKAVSKAAQTQMGALKGKLQYMSPEQAWGKPVDQRSDIFSLGAVLFEMVTGERLFTGDTEISVLESVRQAKVRSARQVDPNVPRDVDEIVSRALASKPEDRFQSAGEMRQQLDSVVHGLKAQPTHAELAAFVRQVMAGGAAAAESPAAAARGSRPGSSPAVPVGTGSGASSAAAAPFPPIAPIGEVRVEEGRKGRSMIVVVAAALVLAIALGIVYFNRKPAAITPAPAPVPHATSGPVATLPAASGPSGASGALAKGAAPKVDVEGIVGQEVAKQAEAMKQKFEDQKKQLEKQLADAAKAAAKTPATADTGRPAAVPAEVPPAPAPEAKEASKPAAANPPASEPIPTTSIEPPRPIEPAAEPPRRQEPAAPVVKVGDLVSLGPGVNAPELVTVPKPEYPPLARKLKIQGLVVVALLVDENGHVSEAKISEGAEQKVGLEEAALAAARAAHYKPGTKNGVRVKMWTRLKVPFKL